MNFTNEIKWHISNPPTIIAPDTLLLVTLSTIVNTEKGIEHTVKTYPAMLKFEDDAAIWTIMDENDSFTIKCDYEMPLHHGIDIEETDENINNERTFTKEIRMILAWAYMPMPHAYYEKKKRCVLVGYNRETNTHTVIADYGNMDMIHVHIHRLCEYAKIHHRFPFEIANGAEFDWLEVYMEPDIGNLEARIAYTDSSYEIKSCMSNETYNRLYADY